MKRRASGKRSTARVSYSVCTIREEVTNLGWRGHANARFRRRALPELALWLLLYVPQYSLIQLLADSHILL